jgi:hypothetical protein
MYGFEDSKTENELKELPFTLWFDLVCASLHPSCQAICFNPKKYKKEDRSRERGANQYESKTIESEKIKKEA